MESLQRRASGNRGWRKKMEDFSKQVVAKVLGRDVTQGELSQAFDKVSPKDHWKNPIDAQVVLSNDFDLLLVAEAVTFFTGSKATFTPVLFITARGKREMRYRVRAAGYFATIGA